MISYDYFCPANNQTVATSHGIKERLNTWGELCAKAGIETGETPPETPVERLISGGLLAMVPGSGGSAPLPMMNGCCGNPSGCGRHG
ncbi:MAG: regulator [Planctomyces sp.]|nr:regulator [Planctomyces sp.]